MATRETLNRYNIIINRLRQSPASFSEIQDRLHLESDIQGYDFNISKRTFQRDIENIESLYGISIAFDFSRNEWYIQEEDNTEANTRLLERSEEHTSELQSRPHLVCRLLLEKKKQNKTIKNRNIT